MLADSEVIFLHIPSNNVFSAIMRKQYDRNKYQRRKSFHSRRPTFGIVINEQAEGFADDKIDFLISELARSRSNWHVIKSIAEKEATYQIKRLLTRQPVGIIVCGGDSTVNLVARNLIRRTCALGIFPLGKYNNIYNSLYGPPDLEKAVDHILSGHSRKIDYGMAGKHFFLGSIGLGLIPNLSELIGQKPPRFGIGWSRKVSLAAASVKAQQTAITIDEFKFDLTPLFININLLSHSLGLSLTPTSIDDDGKAEIVFDIGQGKANFSRFIRKIFKKKYIYSDEIRMYRGQKIIITPVAKRKIYLDGEIIKLTDSTLKVETFPNKIRVYFNNAE